jgi:hypothetical protein
MAGMEMNGRGKRTATTDGGIPTLRGELPGGAWRIAGQ